MYRGIIYVQLAEIEEKYVALSVSSYKKYIDMYYVIREESLIKYKEIIFHSYLKFTCRYRF